MQHELALDLYVGNGETIDTRNRKLADYTPLPGAGDPPAGSYIADEGLRYAVNVALSLGQPLLVTGEPGTGKTQLAASIAHELNLMLLRFDTKTTSTAVDLFYRYDALGRFQDIQLKIRKPPEDYIALQALGKAVLLSNPTDKAVALLPKALKEKGPARCVVLIDEVDKAPRDLPNDILFEIEKMAFRIKETDDEFEADTAHRPILVLTSNSEKNLPDAFLRRCIFYHIEFPKDDATLKAIVVNHFKDPDGRLPPGFTDAFLDGAVSHFRAVRRLDLKKKPATFELMAWLNILLGLKLNLEQVGKAQVPQLKRSYCVLVKNRDDLNRLEEEAASLPGVFA